MSTTDYENSPHILLNRARTTAHTYETLRIQDPTAVHTYETLQNQAAPTAVHTYETLPNQAAPTAVPNWNTVLPFEQNRSPTAVPKWNTQVPPIVQNVPSPPPAYNASPSSQMWTIPAMAPQWSVAGVAAPNSDPSSPFYQTFLKSKPRALGILLIISAILEIALGIGLFYTMFIFTITLPSCISFWGPIFYIIAGSLTIAARAKPNLCLVRGSLSLNIISSIFSLVAVILNSIDLAIIRCYFYLSGNNFFYRRCTERLGSAYAMLSVLLIANVLLFCVSFSLSIFGCRSLSKVTTNGPQVFLIQNDVVVSMNPSTVPATFSGVAQPFLTANAPPHYVFREVKTSPMS